MYNDPMMAILLYRMDVRRAEDNLAHEPGGCDEKAIGGEGARPAAGTAVRVADAQLLSTTCRIP